VAAKNLQIEINPQYPRVAPGLLSWKAWQTLRSADAEALEAFESGDEQAFCEELGDVMLQVVFHARIAAERDDGTSFTVDDVADGIVAKLARRYPHVFAGLTVSGADEVKRNWDDGKREKKKRKELRPNGKG
jgi:uncharacterized protein YabN with tetrapyrrole methylase and pyrophosphatase domain